jgi:predicted porin
MKLSYTAIALAVASSFTTPTFANEVTLYGKANLSVQSSDEGEGRFTEIKSNASRIGVKGGLALDNDLEVIYKAEFEVGLDGSEKNGQSIWSRSQYIGLKGNFGEVLVGKNDTVLKKSQGSVDLFNDLSGDIKHLFKGENRLGNTLTYYSPSMNGWKLGVTYIASESNTGTDGLSLAAFYGDAKLKKSNVYAALAHDQDVKGYDVTRFTFSTKLSGIVLGAMYQNQQPADGNDMDGYLASAKYTVDQITYKAQVQLADFDNGDTNKGFSIGADYKLAKQLKLYGFYTTLNFDSAVDEDFLAVGIEYKF